MKQVIFLSRVTAETWRPVPESVIISIHDKSESPADLEDGWSDRLNVRFHDTDGSVMGLELFDSEKAAQIWEFLRKHRHSASELVVHCHMGESRSAAVALVASEVFGIPCYKHMLPVTWENLRNYNRRVYRELLNWNADHPFVA